MSWVSSPRLVLSFCGIVSKLSLQRQQWRKPCLCTMPVHLWTLQLSISVPMSEKCSTCAEGGTYMTLSFAHFHTPLYRATLVLAGKHPKTINAKKKQGCTVVWKRASWALLTPKQWLHKAMTNCILKTSILATAFHGGGSEMCRKEGPISEILLLKLEGRNIVTVSGK